MMAYFLLIIFSYVTLGAEAPPTNIKVLMIGESTVLNSHPETSIRVQKKGILSIKDRGSKIILVGKKIGTTLVHIGSKSYKFIVAKKPVYESWLQLKKWEKGLRGPQIFIQQNYVKITGRILTINDYLKLRNFTNEDSKFSIESTIAKPLQNQIQEDIDTLLKDNNLYPSPLTFSPELKIQIDEGQKNNLSKYKKILAPFGIKVETDKYVLHQNPVVKIQLHIAHVKKSFFRQWGMKWPSEFTATVAPNSFQGNNFLLSLQSLETNGWGRVLASPTLVAESGKMSEFHSGGEFPVRTSSQFSNSVHWKPYGLFLKVKTIASAHGALQIFIETELSAIDKSVSADGVPGMVRSKIETTLNMKRPHPIVLSGLIKSDSSQNREGLAWLSQIPLLKPLFSSGEVYNNEYELVFILSPSLI